MRQKKQAGKGKERKGDATTKMRGEEKKEKVKRKRGDKV